MPRGKLTGYLALAAIVKPTCWLYVRASTALDSLPAGIKKDPTFSDFGVYMDESFQRGACK